ncbi:DUF6895 family protein [Halorussus caseinilyticus]|uniref:DUF6895 family protein n=1 Tax=Halorussus caseinilyticus TaxID=3034025 RepID=A0ABD5WQA5_9EURY|nr:hypothetical protein [Halorussus sp. DT72]
MSDEASTDDVREAFDPTPRVPDRDVPAMARRLEATTTSWVEGHADRFDPFRWEDKREQNLRRKAFGEAGLYLLHAHELGGGDDLQSLSSVVADHANDERYFRLLQRRPTMVRKFAYPALYADRSGNLRDDRLSGRLTELLNDEAVWAKQRTSFERFDLWHVAKLSGVEPPFSTDGLLAGSPLAHRPDPFRATAKDVNGLVHELMFWRNLGMDAAGASFPDEPAPGGDLREVLTLLLFRYVAEQNYDVGLEVVMSAVLQRTVAPDLVRTFVGHALSRAEELGYLPKSESSLDSDPRFERFSASASEWATHYHANLVAGFASRVLCDHWDEFVAESAPAENHDYDHEDLLKMGRMVEALMDYDLQSGARRLRDLAGTSVAAAYPEAFDAAVRFLRNQRRPDGTFGYWTDVRSKYVSLTGDGERFDEEIVESTTEACSAALAEIDQLASE